MIETLSLLGKMTVNTSDLIRCEIASAMGAFYEGKFIQEIELLEGMYTIFQAVISVCIIVYECILVYMFSRTSTYT